MASSISRNDFTLSSPPDIFGKMSVFVVEPDSYVKVCLRMLVELSKTVRGIYISANRPYLTMKQELADWNIGDRIIFIDCATSLAGVDRVLWDNVIYIAGPSNLTEITISLNSALERIGQGGFVLVDSLCTFLVYAPVETVTRFAHASAAKLKAKGVTGIMLAVDRGATKEIVRTLSMVADRTVRLVGGEPGDMYLSQMRKAASSFPGFHTLQR